MKNKNSMLLTGGEQEPVWVTVMGCGAGFVFLMILLAI